MRRLAVALALVATLALASCSTAPRTRTYTLDVSWPATCISTTREGAWLLDSRGDVVFVSSKTLRFRVGETYTVPRGDEAKK